MLFAAFLACPDNRAQRRNGGRSARPRRTVGKSGGKQADESGGSGDGGVHLDSRRRRRKELIPRQEKSARNAGHINHEYRFSRDPKYIKLAGKEIKCLMLHASSKHGTEKRHIHGKWRG